MLLNTRYNMSIFFLFQIIIILAQEMILINTLLKLEVVMKRVQHRLSLFTNKKYYTHITQVENYGSRECGLRINVVEEDYTHREMSIIEISQ